MIRFIPFLFLFVRFFDAFAGIGGFALPLTEAGHECIGFSEIDKYAIQIYRSHFPSHSFHGDITAIDAASLPGFDLLTGGFPCQAFSIAGKRRGFEDTRGTLFFDLCRIAEAKRPRFLLFENVKGLLGHDEGQTFGTILASLDELGYDLQWEVLNSKNFGVPQNRERVFIVGHLRGQPRPQVFPLGGSDPVNQPVLDNSSRKVGRWQNANAGIVLDNIAPTLRVSGSGNDIRKLPIIVETEFKRREPRIYRGIVPTLKARSKGGAIMPIVDGIRRLTPLEGERLQGFPDQWTAGISDTQRYRCLGNAVTVNVVREIVSRLPN